MLQVIDNQIKLTQGDTAEIEITIFTSEANLDSDIPIEEQFYFLQEGDILKFIVLNISKDGLSNKILQDSYNQFINQNYTNNTNPPVLEKDFTDNIIKLNSNDTKFLNTGIYTYGVVLITKDGQINTIQQGEFIIMKGFLR